PSTRTFEGALTNIALENITHVGRDMSVRVRVRAPGWDAPRSLAPGAGEPARSFGAATRAVVAANGTAWMVASELVNGRRAVVLRARPWQQDWQGAEVVDGGIGTSIDPTIALVGAGDLAVAWISSTGGAGQVCYRARVRGQWTAVRSITAAPGGCQTP